jgi:FkbM family methyltransferase
MTTAPVRTIPVEVGDETIELECFDTWDSALTASVILKGITYPHADVVHDVRVVLDVGANIGAASLYFARTYPDATIHAFEPSAAALPLLRKNVGGFPSVKVHEFGLLDRELEAPLFQGDGDGLTTSVVRSTENSDETSPASFRSAAEWLEAEQISGIDVLKIDTEGAELPILRDLRDRLSDIPLIHLEYHSDDDRRTIDRMLERSHVLFAGRVLQLHRGELSYVAKAAYGSTEELLRNAIALDL